MEYDIDYANLLQEVDRLNRELAAARRWSKAWKSAAIFERSSVKFWRILYDLKARHLDLSS
jgi:hypothetical protein